MKKKMWIILIVKSLINGAIGWLLISALLSVRRGDMTFRQSLTNRYSLAIAAAAVIGSFFGYWKKIRK